MLRGGRLILVVDSDPGLVEDARTLLEGERVLPARLMDEALDIVGEEDVDVVILGPSFANDVGVHDAGSLPKANRSLAIVLCAEVASNHLLRAALQAGFVDVLDVPLTARRLRESLGRSGRWAARPGPLQVSPEMVPPPETAPAAALSPPAPGAGAPPDAAAPAATAAAPVQAVDPAEPPQSADTEPALAVPPETAEPAQIPPPPPEAEGSAAAEDERRVIVVMSAKGGSGKTVMATNLAVGLARELGEDDVVVVDADLQFGDVALLLKMDPTATIVDVARTVEVMSGSDLDDALLRHDSGLRVLPGPSHPIGGGDELIPAIVGLIDRLRAQHRYVIVDTAPAFDGLLLALVDYADDVVVVVDADFPSIRSAGAALDGMVARGVPLTRFRLVVNRLERKARLDRAELEKALGLRAEVLVPRDRLVPQSVNEGVPVVTLNPRSKVARALAELVGLFVPVTRRQARR